MAEQRLELIVDIDETGFVSGIKKIDSADERLTKNTQNNNEKKVSSFKKLSGAIKGLANIYTAVLGTAVVGALGKAISMASDFNESNSKFQTTFALVGKEANKMREELVKSYNLSNKSATELLSTTGDMLAGFGFSSQKALELSGATQKLAADLSSFANIPIEQASEALTKGLLGEREMMKSLGIAINETDLKQRLMAEGKDKLTGMALKQARAEITLAMAMEQSKNAIGDTARTQDSFANVMRSLSNTASDLGIMLGQQLVKQFGPAIKAFRDFVKSEEGVEKITTAFKGLTTVLILIKNVFKLVFGFVYGEIQKIKSSVGVLGDAIKAVKEGSLSGFIKAFKDGAVEIQKTNLDTAKSIGNVFKDTFAEIGDLWKSTKTAQIEGLNEVADANTVAQQTIRQQNEETALQEAELEAEREERAKKRMESAQRVAEFIQQTNDQIGQSIEGLGKLTERIIDATEKNEEERDKKKKDSARAFAVASRVFAIFDIINKTAQSIMGIWAEPGLPLPAKIAGSALAGTAGAIQGAVVASNPLPQFAEGGFTGMASSGRPSSRDTIPAMLAGDENVFNGKQSRNLWSALDMAGLLGNNSRNVVRERVMNNDNRQQNKDIHIHGNVIVQAMDDMFDRKVKDRQSIGGSFV